MITVLTPNYINCLIIASLSAGPYIKFRASDEITEDLTRFNQREIGHKLAIALVKSIGKYDLEEDFVFKMPRIFAGQLPGGLFCINVCTPEPLNNLGQWIQTNGQEINRSFRIHLSQYGYIDNIVYLGPEKDIKSENIISLYGKHEKYLNRLMSRFNDPTQKIQDIVRWGLLEVISQFYCIFTV